MEVQKQEQARDEAQIAALYEAPRIEAVLTEAELEREVIYAGTPSVV